MGLIKSKKDFINKIMKLNIPLNKAVIIFFVLVLIILILFTIFL